MSLSWDVSKVENHEDVCFIWRDYEERIDGAWGKLPEGSSRLNNDENGKAEVRIVNPVTEALVFHTMGVQMGSITKENADEFFARVFFMESADGTLLTGPEGEIRITLEDVHAHIGLYTNVATTTRLKWMKFFVNDRIDMRIRMIQEKRRRDEKAAA